MTIYFPHFLCKFINPLCSLIASPLRNNLGYCWLSSAVPTAVLALMATRSASTAPKLSGRAQVLVAPWPAVTTLYCRVYSRRAWGDRQPSTAATPNERGDVCSTEHRKAALFETAGKGETARGLWAGPAWFSGGVPSQPGPGGTLLLSPIHLTVPRPPCVSFNSSQIGKEILSASSSLPFFPLVRHRAVPRTQPPSGRCS